MRTIDFWSHTELFWNLLYLYLFFFKYIHFFGIPDFGFLWLEKPPEKTAEMLEDLIQG